MPIIIPHTPLYKFIWEINRKKSDFEKTILECGAGGRIPPLAMFKENGFETTGVDISKENIKKAEDFAKKHNLELNIIKADMRELPFEDESFSFVYSYHTIFHLSKTDMKIAIKEINRVLKKGGYFFVNFMSVEDSFYKEGKEISKGEKLLIEHGEKILHTFLEEDELQDFMEGFELIQINKKYSNRPIDWKEYTGCYFDCLLEKI